jgi:SAM-dependent methyltransferase
MAHSSGLALEKDRTRAATDRMRLIQDHIIHEFDEALVLRNMRGCYGELMKRFYGRLLRDVVGNRVLDVGCGFGGFGACCAAHGLQVHSIDIDDESLRIARMLHGEHYHHESVYTTSLQAGSVDTIVINDAVAHLDLSPLMSEIRRLGAKRLLVHDSNIQNPLLRGYRNITGHKEHHDYTAPGLINALEAYGLRCVRCDFVNFLSLPISGGLQRKPIFLLHRFPGVIDGGDRLLGQFFKLVWLDRRLSFRFVAIFDVLDV